MEGYNVQTLEVAGYDALVPNTYWQNGSNTLIILLPGLGYTNQMPLMFYVQQLAIARGWDILQVDYDYRGLPRDTSAEEWSNRMYADVQPVIEAALAQGNYSQIVLAGKSIGTRVMATLLHRGFDKATAHIWLTPLLRSEAVRNAVLGSSSSVAVFGDEDYAVTEVDLGTIAKAGVRMIIMPGGDHSMMNQSSVPQSIAGLAQVIFELDTWLQQHIPVTGEQS